MNDPHVERLFYSVVTDETLDFADPEPVSVETDAFRIQLADGELTVEMLEHHAEPASACDVVEPYLEAWSILGRDGHVWFEFEDADVIDRDPPEEDGVVMVAAAGEVSVAGSASIMLTAGSYPDPPGAFEPSPTVRRMVAVYRDYLDGKRTIGSMGYYCLTELQERLGSGKSWRKQINVSSNVASTISRLTGGVGDHRTGRKVGTEHRPHTGAETEWIKRAVALLIQRLGEWEYNSDRGWPKLTLEELPDLSD